MQQEVHRGTPGSVVLPGRSGIEGTHENILAPHLPLDPLEVHGGEEF